MRAKEARKDDVDVGGAAGAGEGCLMLPNNKPAKATERERERERESRTEQTGLALGKCCIL